MKRWISFHLPRYFCQLMSGLTIGGTGILGMESTVLAQVIPDDSLGAEGSIVSPIDDFNTRIDGGAIRGANLFHSFREFNIDDGLGASFSNPTGIENILTRVTGGNPSNIFGTLGVLGNANLFFINPNGIVFGPNARLDVGGSFLASTAEAIDFPNGSQFSASNADTPPLLTVNVPIGLQFGAEPGDIRVTGPGHNLREERSRTIIFDDRPAGLEVLPDRTLALVGGNIELVGGNLTAPGGRIELGSVGGNNTVAIVPNENGNENGWELGYDGVQSFQDIQLVDAASIDTSSEGAGAINLQGRSIFFGDGSIALAITQGSQPGDAFTVRGSESVEATGFITAPSDDFFNFGGGFISFVAVGATGGGGNLTFETPLFRLDDRARALASTAGIGNGGELRIVAPQVEVLEGAVLRAGIRPNASGNGGNLTIDTDRLLVQERAARISTATSGSGNAGALTIRATESIEAIDGRILAGSNRRATGDGGVLRLETGRLLARDGTQIASNTIGGGNAGDLIIVAEEVEVIDSADGGQRFTGLFAQVNPNAEANGGTIVLQADRLTVRDGGKISVSTDGLGTAGNSLIRATVIELVGVSPDGAGGSALLANVDEDGMGDGGNLTIEADRLIVRDGAEAIVSSRGVGGAGNLTVRADRIDLDNGILGATLLEGDEGNITVNAADIRLRNGSSIIASAGGNSDGGNVTVESETLVLLEESTLNANAVAGRGGNVRITTSGLFQDAGSRISASSALGVDGIVDRNTPEVDPSAGLVKLPENVVDISALVGRDPCSGGDRSEFTVVGRGGIPPSPADLLPSTAIVEPRWLSLGDSDEMSPTPTPIEGQTPTQPDAPTEPLPERLVEAQGWIVGPQGEIQLTAIPYRGSIDSLRLVSLECHDR